MKKQTKNVSPKILKAYLVRTSPHVLILPAAIAAGKVPMAWANTQDWVPISSYKKQLVKTIWGRILGLAWLKFPVTFLCYV